MMHRPSLPKYLHRIEQRMIHPSSRHSRHPHAQRESRRGESHARHDYDSCLLRVGQSPAARASRAYPAVERTFTLSRLPAEVRRQVHPDHECTDSPSRTDDRNKGQLPERRLDIIGLDLPTTTRLDSTHNTSINGAAMTQSLKHFLVGLLKENRFFAPADVVRVVAEILKSQENVESEIIACATTIPAGTRTEIDTKTGQRSSTAARFDIISSRPRSGGEFSPHSFSGASERLDELNDEQLNRQSDFANKVGGIVITGDEDGAEHIIATS